MRGWIVVLLFGAAGCDSRGEVQFTIREPELAVFDPVSARITQFQVKAADGTLLGVASQTAQQAAVLPLGPLQPTAIPEDVVVSLFSGSALQGMARIRDVSVKKDASLSYIADVRKPLIFVGSALPDETDAQNQIVAGEIIDPTTGANLARPKMPDPRQPAPQVPTGMSAAVVTSDGRFLLAGRPSALTVFDTSTGISVGDLKLPATPSRVAVAPRDAAALVLIPSAPGSDTALLLNDLIGLELAPADATTQAVTLGLASRTAVFSPDGTRVYILSGGTSADPCAPGAKLDPNSITVLNVDGTIEATWSMPEFVSDVAVQADGVVLVSQAAQVGTLDPTAPTGVAAPKKLFAATCPSALSVVGDQLFAVTSARDSTFVNAFVLQRVSLTDGTVTPLPFGGGSYQVPTGDMPTPDGNTTVVLEIKAASLMAYELAVTPDASRAVFATRSRYHESKQAFTVVGLDCEANLDIVEYGLYSLDTSSGNASYELRAQLVTSPTVASGSFCISCPTQFGDLGFPCPSGPGDRPAGVAAIFGGP